MKRYWRNESVGSRQSAIGKVENQLLRLVAYCLLLTAYCLLESCSQNKKQAQAEVYTCPMHPTVVQAKPGSCPVCGMDLVLKVKHKEEVKVTAGLNYLLKPANSAVISSIKIVTPIRKSMEVKTNANGVITYDTRAVTTISSRFNGRIEKLFVKYNFQPIHKGQKILEIYSPELLTAQRDLLYLLKSDKENSLLIEGAKEKLKLLGTSDGQISQLVSTGEESSAFNVYSPAEGYITNSSESQVTQSELDVREGMYVTTGQQIFKVANPKNVWAEFDLYTKDAALVKINDPIQIRLDNSSDGIDAKINFIQPFYKDQQSFTKVRVYLSNGTGKYGVGRLISASFSKPSQDSMWIPLSSQFDLGTKKVVFTKREGVFRPKEIIVGNQSDDWIQVLKGIDDHDSIAYNAQFMIDSESFIKIKN